MYEKILFPTDFSEYAQKTLQCIGDIPGVREVVLLHVVDATHYSVHGWVHEQHIEDAKIRLEEQREYLQNLGLKTDAKVDVITSGDISNTILEIADEENVSLIVMNARGKSLIRSLLLGSIPLAVIRHTKTDVLLMRHKLVENLEGEKFEKFCPMILSKVLYPTDFSEPAKKTLSFIKGLKEIREIVLVHVVTKGETPDEIDINVQKAKKELGNARDELEQEQFKVKEHIRIGNPTEEICSLAEEEDASLIMMNSHGKSWLKEILLGGTVFDVIKTAKRPILIVRTK